MGKKVMRKGHFPEAVERKCCSRPRTEFFPLTVVFCGKMSALSESLQFSKPVTLFCRVLF